MSYMDLHLHSSVSLDGEISPRGLAELCRQEGVRFAALTDHNAVSGTQEFSWRGAQLGVRVIPGIEIDCMAEDLHLHMLGYGIDSANDELVKLEHTVKEMQRAASVEQMDALENLGIFLDRDALMEQAKDGVISAEAMAKQALQLPQNHDHSLLLPFLPGGMRCDQPLVNFYWDLCSFISAKEAIQLIHNAGGLAVLAHPAMQLQTTENRIEYFLPLELDGLEVFSSYHNAIETAFYLEVAKKHHLLITGGSDFHGMIKPNIRIGGVDMLYMEDMLTAQLLDALGMTASS